MKKKPEIREEFLASKEKVFHKYGEVLKRLSTYSEEDAEDILAAEEALEDIKVNGTIPLEQLLKSLSHD